MAFESLSERLNKAFKNISGQGKLTEKNMNDMLKEVRMSLLEADVNYDVVKSFVENVKEKALGQEVLDSLNPSQMVVKIVHDELQVLLGEEDARIHFKKQGMTTVMMVGFKLGIRSRLSTKVNGGLHGTPFHSVFTIAKQQQVQRLRITAKTN